LSLQTDYFSGFGFYLSVTGFYQGKSSGWKVKEAAAAELRITQDDIEEEEIGDYADVDLSVGYRFRLGGAQMNLQFSGNNLFDASGYQFYLLGKRNLQVSLSVRY
ncbi:MAG TPA: TonB-dependent receptor, partial [Calditrichia bacterium]|nr:TonB-dependent receptor [Calditrichia bacterium]